MQSSLNCYGVSVTDHTANQKVCKFRTLIKYSIPIVHIFVINLYQNYMAKMKHIFKIKIKN